MVSVKELRTSALIPSVSSINEERGVNPALRPRADTDHNYA